MRERLLPLRQRHGASAGPDGGVAPLPARPADRRLGGRRSCSCSASRALLRLFGGERRRRPSSARARRPRDGGGRSQSCSARELGPERVIPVDVRTTIASSAATSSPMPSTVTSRRTRDLCRGGAHGGGPVETVQAPIEAQPIPDGPALIGFTVAAAALLDACGPGDLRDADLPRAGRRADRRRALHPGRPGPEAPASP